MSDRALIAREAAISAAINGVLSLIFFMVVFGLTRPVPLAALAVDGLPQTFMVALMGSLVPGLIVAAKRSRARLPVFRRAVGIAVLCLAVLGGASWMLLHASAAAFAPLPVLIAKVAYGVLLGAIITPFAVHRVLRQDIRT